MAGCDRGAQHLPRPLALAVPQLPDLVGDPLARSPAPRRRHPDLDQRPQNLVRERAPRELLGFVGRREAGLDRDARVQRGADDARPAELGQVDRDEVGARRHGSHGRRPRERIRIDRR